MLYLRSHFNLLNSLRLSEAKAPSLASSNSRALNKSYFLRLTLPNFWRFHWIIPSFKAFNLFANTWLGVPEIECQFHQEFTLSTNPSVFNHIFLNRKGLFPLAIPPASKRIGKWSETGRGRIRWITSEKCCSQSYTRALSILEMDDWSVPLDHV